MSDAELVLRLRTCGYPNARYVRSSEPDLEDDQINLDDTLYLQITGNGYALGRILHPDDEEQFAVEDLGFFPSKRDILPGLVKLSLIPADVAAAAGLELDELLKRTLDAWVSAEREIALAGFKTDRVAHARKALEHLSTADAAAGLLKARLGAIAAGPAGC